jgi:hypothetical protein
MLCLQSGKSLARVMIKCPIDLRIMVREQEENVNYITDWVRAKPGENWKRSLTGVA